VSRGGAVRGTLGQRTRQVLEVLATAGRPMYSREIAAHIPDLRRSDIGHYTHVLRDRGLIYSWAGPGRARDGSTRRLMFNELTAAGRQTLTELGWTAPPTAVRVPAQRGPHRPAGVAPEVNVAALAERCDTAAVALVERAHIDRAEPERALRDVAVVLTALGCGLADDPLLAGRFLSLAKSCQLAADRWTAGSSDPGRDRDVTWQTLRAVVRVLRELTADQPVGAPR
jgi:hypothetical protein